jgi:hypothetical protein
MTKIKLDGKLFSLSQSNDGTTLDAKFLICPLDEANLNLVGLREADLTDAEKNGLTNQPVVCKVIKNSDGQYDATGHNMKIKYETNEKGDLVKVYDFDTSPVGFHTSTQIEEIEIGGVKKRCITATAKLWTRYTNFMKALQYLIDNGKVVTSWEIAFDDSYIENNIKWLKDITWLGNCILGSTVSPSYRDAGLLELAEENEEVKLAVAFTQDLETEISSQSVEITVEDITIKNQGGTDNMTENKTKKEIASLTSDDIYTKVRSAINATNDEKWYYIAMLFPLEFRAIAYSYGREKDSDFVEFTYVVSSDETVSITAQKEVEMVFIPKENYDTVVSELQAKVTTIESKLAEKETELSTKLDEVIKLGEEIVNKETALSQKDIIIAELTPYKEKIEVAETVAKEAEIAQKKEDLKKFALKGGYILAEELETSEELIKAIDELNEKAIKLEIAERVMAKLELAEKETKEKEVETSEVKAGVIEKNLNANNSILSASDVMNAFLN